MIDDRRDNRDRYELREHRMNQDEDLRQLND